MKIKTNLSITIIILLLSFTSCQKENGQMESKTETQGIQEDDFPTSNIASGRVCESLSNDPNLALLVNLMTADNFVYNSMLQDSTKEGDWNNLQLFLDGQDPTMEVNQSDIEFYIGADHTEFLSYGQNVTNTMGALINTHLTELSEIEVIDAFECAIEEYLEASATASSIVDNKKNKSGTRASCCQQVKAEYLNCIKNAKSSAAALFTAEVTLSIGVALFTGGSAVLWGVVSGTITGGLQYASDKKGCNSTCALKSSHCSPPCTSACD